MTDYDITILPFDTILATRYPKSFHILLHSQCAVFCSSNRWYPEEEESRVHGFVSRHRNSTVYNNMVRMGDGGDACS